MALHYSIEKNVQMMVALLKAHGIRKVVASPGTTNITFVGSLMHDPFFQIYSSVDERSAAYIACGMAEESGEPVVISCTGATASRNYFSGLTEAYYRKLPILAITSTREECKIGHLIDQQIDRTQQPKDTVVCSEHLQLIKDEEDWWNCTIKANRAILALRHNGGGPVHINLPTYYSNDFSVERLPEVRKISRYYAHESLPEIGKRDVAVFIGTHKQMNVREQNAIDAFCEKYNAVVFCDCCSGYHGKYRLTQFANSENLKMDLLIHLGEVSACAYSCKPNEVWRVNEDGELRDTYRKLTNVYCMPEFVFFEKYTTLSENKDTSKFESLIQHETEVYHNRIKDVTFSNGWIASYLHDKFPENSVVHLGIVSTYYAWNKFKFSNTLNINCNQGGFGIDGNLSSLIGASLVNAEKLYYCVLGDLAFFYDLNSLGNRHVGNNIRILLINNGRGVIFRKPSNLGAVFGEEADLFMAAGGHFGSQSPTLVRDFVTNLGFDYISADTKEAFREKVPAFVNPKLTERPMVFEVFVDLDGEIEGDKIMRYKASGLKGIVQDFIGEENFDKLKSLVRPDKEIGVIKADMSGKR